MPPVPPPFQAYPADRVLALLESGDGGLSPEEARARLALHGSNRLPEEEGEGPLRLFARQFTDLLILILAAAAVISGALGEWLEAAAILAIILLNGIIGFLQEYRAGKTLEALKRMTVPVARVLRAGEGASVDARELVPGDIILLGEGDRVPADARLLETVALAADEAPLTGESVPVPKDAGVVCPPEETIHGRGNMVFLGTAVTRGRGKAVVTATGTGTELGKIAEVVAGEPVEATPLQRKLAYLGKQLSVAALAIVGVIFLAGLVQGREILGMFLVAVSLAVAAIPEGLPAVVTITLSLGVQRMAAAHAIVRRLPAVETLGAATVICTDKTGTLTLNEMTARTLFVNGTFLRVTGEGYAPPGGFLDEAGGPVSPLSVPGMQELLEAGELCNNAALTADASGKPGILGDPTEASLLVLAAKAGLPQERLLASHPFAREIPFDSARKMMTVVRSTGGRERAYVKGAPEVLLGRCSRILRDGMERELLPGDRDAVLGANGRMASGALRVLGFAYRDLPPGMPDDAIEEDLVFTGLAGMMDPPRPEAKEAVRACRAAGIRVVMVTGDNPLTAGAVARELDLGGGGTMTGAELDRVTDDALRERVGETGIYARVDPGHKLRIVDALQARGEIVAMTGDGVNDAPALRRADIGVAMGITGTEVAKEASDMVITDDNFASIQRAVGEGRVIYANILLAVQYLIACNIGELVTIFAAILAGLASPLTPLQILWMNLVTDSPPALALAMNPPDPGVMDRPPQDPEARIVTPAAAGGMLLVGLLMAAVTLAVFTGQGAVVAGTMAFSVIILFQKFFALAVSGDGLLRNRWLWAAFLFGILSQVLITSWGPAQAVFETVALTPYQWGVVLLASSTGFIIPVAVRWIRRVSSSSSPAPG
jgi:P-type Ca2+ transporter type 2C